MNVSLNISSSQTSLLYYVACHDDYRLVPSVQVNDDWLIVGVTADSEHITTPPPQVCLLHVHLFNVGWSISCNIGFGNPVFVISVVVCVILYKQSVTLFAIRMINHN